jgi:hypothetical protein
MNKLFYLPFFILLLYACDKKSNCVENPKGDCLCITLYDPVCGCNDVTYGNDCEAACAGIGDYTKGRCAYDIKPLIGKWNFLGYVSEGAKFKSDLKTHKYEMAINLESEKTGDLHKLSGRSAINFILGDYEIANLNQLNINADLASKIAGTIEDLTYEDLFVNYINGANIYTIDGDYLKMESDYSSTPSGTDRVNEVLIFRKD